MLLTPLFVFLILMAISCPSGSFIIVLDRIFSLLFDGHDASVESSEDQLDNSLIFNSTHQTIIFIDDYHNCSSKYAIDKQMRKTYLEKGPYNFISANWIQSENSPIDPTLIDEQVGKRVTNFLYRMHKKQKISLSQLHIIGFGRGANIAADVSHNLLKLGVPEIGRITGLDPFEIESHNPMNRVRYLNRSSATYVDIIFTTYPLLETKKPKGHVEFFVDFAQHQPQCENLICCKHNYAWKLYLNSVHHPQQYPSRSCLFHFHKPICRVEAGQYMGIASNSSKPGIFYVIIPNADYNFIQN